MLEIRKEAEGEKTVLYLKGRLDVNAARDNEAMFIESAAETMDLVIDCENLTYISSAGLRDFIHMQKDMDAKKGSLVIKNVSQEVMEIFSTTGFVSIMHFE